MDKLLFWLTTQIMVSLSVESNSVQGPNSIEEYCWPNVFNATCNESEVILMETAYYGRMKLGRCLKSDFHIGCKADVLSEMDARCSGKKSCLLTLPDTKLHKIQPCPHDMVAYMEASYSCVKVGTGSPFDCRNFGTIELTGDEGFITSTPPHSHGTIQTSCPYTIKVQEGQKVNITLYDFSLAHNSKRTDTICHVYGNIKEKATQSEITVCGGFQRIRHIHLSESNQMEVEILPTVQNEDRGYFLLKYQAVGCPNPTLPKGSWMRRDGDKLTVSCNDTTVTWHLVCENNRWIGRIGNCSTGGGEAMGQSFSNDQGIPYGIILAVMIGVALGIVFGCLLLGIVVICDRRRREHGYEKPDNIRPLPSSVNQAHYSLAEDNNLNHYKQYTIQDYGHGGMSTLGWDGYNAGGPSICEQATLPLQRCHYLRHKPSVNSLDNSFRSKEHSYESPRLVRAQDGSCNAKSPVYHELDPMNATEESKDPAQVHIIHQTNPMRTDRS